MARSSQKKTTGKKGKNRSDFYDKLVLNLFIIHLFGIDVLH